MRGWESEKVRGWKSVEKRRVKVEREVDENRVYCDDRRFVSEYAGFGDCFIMLWISERCVKRVGGRFFLMCGKGFSGMRESPYGHAGKAVWERDTGFSAARKNVAEAHGRMRICRERAGMWVLCRQLWYKMRGVMQSEREKKLM